MHVLTLSAIAVLVFAAVAVAQDVPQGQDPSQNEPDINTATDTNSTSVQKRTTTRTTSSSTTTVDITDDAFDPSELNIAAGTTVTFVNNGTGLHTATADNGLFDSGELAPGASYPVVLDGAGTVTYHCELHPEMQGSIVVGEAGQASEVGEAGEGGGAEEGTTTTEDPTSDPVQKASATQDLPGSDSTQTSGGS
jgi:plastocyanin